MTKINSGVSLKGNSSNKLLILIIILLLIIISGMVGVGLGVYKNYGLKGHTLMKVEASELENKSTSNLTFDIGEFTSNLKSDDKGRPHYIKAKISLGYSNENLSEVLEGKKNAIRDIVNMTLLAKSQDDLRTEKLEDVKNEMLEKINKLINIGKVEALYFGEIITQ